MHSSGDKSDVIPAATSVRCGSRPLGRSRSMTRWKDNETKARMQLGLFVRGPAGSDEQRATAKRFDLAVARLALPPLQPALAAWGS